MRGMGWPRGVAAGRGAARWGAGATVQDISDNLNGGRLCRALRKRVQELGDKAGDRVRTRTRQFCPGGARRVVGKKACVLHAFLRADRPHGKER